MEKLTAIIAGTGTLPLEACKSLKAQSVPFFVISLFPEDNGETLKQLSDDVFTKDFYKPSEILNLIKSKDGKRVLMIGKVDKKNLLKKIKLDWLAIKSLASLFSKSDKTIMEKILSIFSDNDIEVIHQSQVLNSLIIPPGILTGKLSSNFKRDVEIGIDMAMKISEFDIGQTVVIKDGMILAIEAIEGTDKCIKRGIDLGKDGVVICKGASVNQNQKYDLPTLGPDTIKNLRPGEVSTIAWQSSRTLIAQKDEFISLAKQLGITLVSC